MDTTLGASLPSGSRPTVPQDASPDPRPPALEPTECHLEVPRTARYWTLGTPSPAGELWFVLHGYKQLARRFLRRFEPIASPDRCIVAPEGLSRFYASAAPGRHGPDSPVGATWMTREDRANEIRDYVRYLDALGEAVGAAGVRRTVVLGFSQGVATAARWTTLGALRPDRLLLWGDLLPPDLDLALAREAWAGTEVVLVRGERDGAISPARADEERARIGAAGLDVRRVGYPGGHDIDQHALRALAAPGGT